jgi:hypothetical protein
MHLERHQAQWDPGAAQSAPEYTFASTANKSASEHLVATVQYHCLAFQQWIPTSLAAVEVSSQASRPCQGMRGSGEI